MRSAYRLHGIALAELLLVVGIAAALAALALPRFEKSRRSAAITVSANQMVGALHFARSASILRGIPAVVCLSSDGAQCVGRNDATGWLVFLDFQRSSPPRRDAEDELLRHFELPPRVSVHGTRPALTYWPTSRLGTTGTFTFCNVGSPNEVGSEDGRAVVVSQTGRPRVAAATGTECLS